MQNKPGEIFFILLVAFLFFIFLSPYTSKISIGNYAFKEISLLEDITVNENIREANLRDSPFVEKDSQAGVKNLISSRIDSVVLKANVLGTSTDTILNVSIKDSIGNELAIFFEAINAFINKKSKKIRVAHFGDSRICGDVVTEELRRLLQEKFGGTGVGFVPIAYNDYDRQTITNSSSSNWKKYTLKEPVSNKYPLGISGFAYEPSLVNNIDLSNLENAGGSWVQYDAVDRPGLDGFYDVKLFYGPGIGNNYIYYNQKNKKLNGAEAVNQLILNDKTVIPIINVNFVCQSPVNIFGFSFESPNGIFVDNFGIGSTWGTELIKIQENELKGFNKYMDYNLVLIDYGLNALTNTPLNEYPVYEKNMIEIINRFKVCFPNASVLVLGISDYWEEQRGINMPNPRIHQLINLQQQIAKKTNSSFWNLFEAMGGNRSMDTWVKAGLGRKDYAHFTPEGGKKEGVLLYNFIMNKYNEHKIK